MGHDAAPAVVPAQTDLDGVQAKDRIFEGVQLVGMHAAVELLGGVMQGAGLDGLPASRGEQTVAVCIRQGDPAHAGAVAGFGGFHIGEKVVRHRGGVSSHLCALETVDVILLRPAAEPFHALIHRRHRHLHARHRHIDQAVGIMRNEPYVRAHRAVAVNGISHIQFRAVQAGIGAQHGDHGAVLPRLHRV